MKPYVFVIISKNSEFSEKLKTRLDELGQCFCYTDIPQESLRGAQLVFCDNDLLTRLPSLPSLVIPLSFFSNKPNLLNSGNTIYIDVNSDYKEVSALIFEKVKKVNFSSPVVYSITEQNTIPPVTFHLVHAKKVLINKTQRVVEEPPKVIKPTAVKKNHSKRKISKIVLFGMLVILWGFLLPLVTFALSSLLTLVSFNEFKGLRMETGIFVVNISRPLASFSTKSAQTLALLPSPLGTFYQSLGDLSSIEESGLGIISEGVSVLSKFSKTQSLLTLSENKGSLDKIDRDLQGFIAKVKKNQVVKNLLPQKVDEYALLFSAFVSWVDKPETFLGLDKPSTYLLLFQNNMELRPTGGFIGSFALVSIDKGKVYDPKIYDVYDADGQLDGYVAPPDPIRRYLGEASWKMRDSNWDPDFSVSARRATWFLDKTLNKQAAAVIAIDLEVLKSILDVTGPVNVIDYNEVISSSDFYQKIQDEVHEDFFPGTKKKSNYLTAVTSSVLTKVLENKSSWKGVLESILKNIESHDVQVFSSEAGLQNSLKEAKLVNQLPENAVGFVEANLGVNKANQYIKREGNITIKKGEAFTLTLTIKNEAKEKNDQTRYRVYLRSFAPTAFTPQNVAVVGNGIERTVIPEIMKVENREEAGIFTEIDGGEEQTITFTWQKSKDIGINNFIFWKQPGVLPYDLTISLTGTGDRQYNTQVDKNLVVDF